MVSLSSLEILVSKNDCCVSKYVNGEILFIPFPFVTFGDTILCLSFEGITIGPYWIVTTFPLRGSPEGRKVPHKQTSTQYNRVAHKCDHFFRAWVRLTLSSCPCSPRLIAVPFPCNLNVCIASSSFVFFPTRCRPIPFSCCCGTQPQFPTALHKWPSVAKKKIKKLKKNADAQDCSVRNSAGLQNRCY